MFQNIIICIVKFFYQVWSYFLSLLIGLYIILSKYVKKLSFEEFKEIVILIVILVIILFGHFCGTNLRDILLKRKIFLYKRILFFYLKLYCDQIVIVSYNLIFFLYGLYSILYQICYCYLVKILTSQNLMKNINLRFDQNKFKIKKKPRKEWIKLLEIISFLTITLDYFLYYKFVFIGRVHFLLPLFLILLLFFGSLIAHLLIDDILWEDEQKTEIIYHILKACSYAIFSCSIILSLVNLGFFS